MSPVTYTPASARAPRRAATVLPRSDGPLVPAGLPQRRPVPPADALSGVLARAVAQRAMRAGTGASPAIQGRCRSPILQRDPVATPPLPATTVEALFAIRGLLGELSGFADADDARLLASAGGEPAVLARAPVAGENARQDLRPELRLATRRLFALVRHSDAWQREASDAGSGDDRGPLLQRFVSAAMNVPLTSLIDDLPIALPVPDVAPAPGSAVSHLQGVVQLARLHVDAGLEEIADRPEYDAIAATWSAGAAALHRAEARLAEPAA